MLSWCCIICILVVSFIILSIQNYICFVVYDLHHRFKQSHFFASVKLHFSNIKFNFVSKHFVLSFILWSKIYECSIKVLLQFTTHNMDSLHWSDDEIWRVLLWIIAVSEITEIRPTAPCAAHPLQKLFWFSNGVQISS